MMEHKADERFPHDHFTFFQSTRCIGCLEAADDDFISEVMDYSSLSRASRNLGPDKKIRTRPKGAWHKEGARKLTDQEEAKARELFAKYIKNAREKGKYVDSQWVRHCYWLNAVRWATHTKERTALKMRRERHTNWRKHMAYSVLKYRKEKKSGVHKVKMPHSVGEV